VFSHYVAERLSQGPVPELRKVLAYVETKLTETTTLSTTRSAPASSRT